MHLDALIHPHLPHAAHTAATAEQLGFHGLWTNETAHDPFLPLVPAALATQRVQLGTAVAIAFPRSPTALAYTAYDLAHASHGRFILGLGTQVKAHIERRFSVPWTSPVERLRDYIGALRAVWSSWQTGDRLRYESHHYNIKLMTPFFSPPPLPDPTHIPPVYIAGVNQRLATLAGELCDGFHVHPFHTPLYLQQNVLPWIQSGLAASNRHRTDIQLCASVFAITGPDIDRVREETRKQIAFYASTPSYRTQLEAHGWSSTGETLSKLASRGRWDDMAPLITDDMLSQIAVEAPTLPEAALILKSRYTGLADRLALYLPFTPGERDDEWAEATALFGDPK